jgi:putative transposase
VVWVSGKGSGRIPVAGLACYKPGARSRLFYRVRTHRGRKGERRSMSEADYASLVTAAHHQLHAPMILVWDNLNTHISAAMRAFIDAHPGWLTEARLPAYQGRFLDVVASGGGGRPVRPRCRPHRLTTSTAISPSVTESLEENARRPPIGAAIGRLATTGAVAPNRPLCARTVAWFGR